MPRLRCWSYGGGAVSYERGTPVLCITAARRRPHAGRHRSERALQNVSTSIRNCIVDPFVETGLQIENSHLPEQGGSPSVQLGRPFFFSSLLLSSLELSDTTIYEP